MSVKIEVKEVYCKTNKDVSAWLRKLADDIDSGMVDDFELSTVRRDGCISGNLFISPPTGLSVELELPRPKEKTEAVKHPTKKQENSKAE